MATAASIINGGLQNPNLSVINNAGGREVVRCAQCLLVQFRTVSDLCRRCDRPLPRPLELSDADSGEAEEVAIGAPPQSAVREAPVPAIGYRGKTMADFSLGPRLRELREFKNLTQAQIARKARVPRTYISRIEHCHLLPGLGVAQRLADALAVGILELLPNSSKPSGDSGPSKDPYWSSFAHHFQQLRIEQQSAVLSRVRAILRQRPMSSAANSLAQAQ